MTVTCMLTIHSISIGNHGGRLFEPECAMVRCARPALTNIALIFSSRERGQKNVVHAGAGIQLTATSKARLSSACT